MNKTYNLNEIYIGLIAKQIKIIENTKIINKNFPVQVGLFIKKNNKYVHIPTNISYSLINESTKNSYGVIESTIKKFYEHNQTLVNKFINEGKFQLNVLQIQAIEQRYNNLLVDLLDIRVEEDTNPEKF